MQELLYKEDSFAIIGCCMEVHNELGKGHNEVIYKDALEIEFRSRSIGFAREQPYALTYKGVLLPHSYFSDFVIAGKIILEVKAVEFLTDSHIKQPLNYLAASKLKLGLLVNFGEDSLSFKRVLL